MRIFVTGGSGFIGRALIKALAEQGHEVRVLTRQPDQLNPPPHPAITTIPGDLSEPPLLRKAMTGCQQVYHLAALARPWARQVDEFDRSNIEGTRNILQVSLEAGIKRMIHTSTVMATGPTDGFVADESTPLPRRYLSHYQRTKAIAEEQVKEFVRKGLPAIIVRPSLVYGPGISKRAASFNQLLHAFLTGKPIMIPGNGRQRLNCVYLEDVVMGHLKAMEQGRIGECYILGGENITVDEIVILINKTMGIKRKIMHIPYWTAKVAGLIDETRARIIGGTPLITWSSVETYRHSWTCSSKKAMRELGYQPRLLKEGLKPTLQWTQDSRNMD